MQVTDEMVRVAAEAMAAKRSELQHLPLARIYGDLSRAALEAALGAMWRPAESDSNGLLYFPKKVTGHYSQYSLPEMMKVGLASDYPNRLPTHFMPLPSPPAQEG